MKLKARNVKSELKLLSDPQKAKTLKKYFKTGKGEYGEGDKFLGISVPQQRKIAQKYSHLPFTEIKILLAGNFHEYRFTGLVILVLQYKKAKPADRKKIVKFYLQNIKAFNNWDLVDSSASQILGDWLLDKDRKILYQMANRKDLWQRRIAIIATHSFIKNGQFADTKKIVKKLIRDPHDLIHKACGWMLREIGERSKGELEDFLLKNHTQMPRVMIRYALEKMPANKRNKFLKNQNF